MAASLTWHVVGAHQTSNHVDSPIVFDNSMIDPRQTNDFLASPIPALNAVVHTVKSLQIHGILTKKLAIHGALLFRDLPIHGAFSQFAHAFGYKPHQIIGIVVDRPLLALNVAPANESPKEVLIYNQNESSQVPHAPEYVFFYSHKALSKGGETPISSSLELFHRAKKEIPEFIQELTDKGILSRVTYKFDKQYTGGSTLQQAFGKEFLEGDNDGVMLTHRLPAIPGQPGTGLPTLFTGLAAYWKNSQEGNGARKEVTKQLYGDGTPIPDKYLEHLAKITDAIRHGRQPWEVEQSDRVVLASLFDGDSVPGAYGDGDWVQVVQAVDD
ncbi:hypothetical protein BDP55DRAFT_696897 [Colletotrichum godetiae]|uniref:TauD/TfdA-like domain-containing protein n=1 Tax=Colletotrichum godetiae TaxID=1209918 RepID=A0AAJ0EQ61_9PEZI|nr:uncharacterized protein BDP55DRAFT_696897 [Colletotrichum godetiae]KAK1671272.1 hypothetical protein BDP55DRAFT_696897 [Colletotrichum godetiae]